MIEAIVQSGMALRNIDWRQSRLGWAAGGLSGGSSF